VRPRGISNEGDVERVVETGSEAGGVRKSESETETSDSSIEKMSSMSGVLSMAAKRVVSWVI
jgi:hypothetical protein